MYELMCLGRPPTYLFREVAWEFGNNFTMVCDQ